MKELYRFGSTGTFKELTGITKEVFEEEIGFHNCKIEIKNNVFYLTIPVSIRRKWLAGNVL